MTKRPIIAKGHNAKECLKLMHTNVYGIIRVHTWREYGNFMSFIDEYSKF